MFRVVNEINQKFLHINDLQKLQNLQTFHEKLMEQKAQHNKKNNKLSETLEFTLQVKKSLN